MTELEAITHARRTLADVQKQLAAPCASRAEADAVGDNLLSCLRGSANMLQLTKRQAAPIVKADPTPALSDRFATPGDALVAAAQVIAKRDGVDVGTALGAAAVEHPELFARYRAGDRW